MFDGLLALMAIVNSAINATEMVLTEKNMSLSNKGYNLPQTTYNVPIDNTVHAVKSETPDQRMKREYIEREAARRVAARHAENTTQPKLNPMAEWVMSHDTLLLEVLKPGVHLIPNEDMKGMNPEEIAAWLIDNCEPVESVDHIATGLEVTVR